MNPSIGKLLLTRTQLTGLHATIFSRKKRAHHKETSAAENTICEKQHEEMAWDHKASPCSQMRRKPCNPRDASGDPGLATTANTIHFQNDDSEA